MPHHSHSEELPLQTEGRLIGHAGHYEVFVNLISFGQIKRLREQTVRLAQIKPGDIVLDVGCGAGAVTIPAKLRTGQDGLVGGIDPAP
jgi:ubiquinone/menaquinone biosynthesis C-methylase UbiE